MTITIMITADVLICRDRLIKEGICDKTTVPSVSAISRLLRGRDEDEVKKSSECLTCILCFAFYDLYFLFFFPIFHFAFCICFLHFTFCILHFAFCILHFAFWILDFEFWISHFAFWGTRSQAKWVSIRPLWPFSKAILSPMFPKWVEFFTSRGGRSSFFA